MLHYFDGYEDPVHWWQPCPKDCTRVFPMAFTAGLAKLRQIHRSRKRCHRCSILGDRLSAISIFRGQQRSDRRRIPAVSGLPGIVLRPNRTQLLCAFGGDAGTMSFNCRHQPSWRQTERCIPGCGNPPPWCDPEEEPLSSKCRCGVGQGCATPLRPVKPERLGWVLAEHAKVGGADLGLGSYSGYAELVVDSAPLQANPVDAIEAFFYINEASSENVSQRLACKVHAAFVHRYQLNSCDVPILRLRLDDWESPFEMHQRCSWPA